MYLITLEVTEEKYGKYKQTKLVENPLRYYLNIIEKDYVKSAVIINTEKADFLVSRDDRELLEELDYYTIAGNN